jgi:FixJ family two-component response regulator
MDGLSLRDSSEKIAVVVDDEPQIRKALAGLLSAAQFMVAEFSSAADVLKSGLLQRACCLITDVRMPGMSGLELESIVRLEFPELPVFVITAHRDGQLEKAGALGSMTRLFYKPLDPDALLSAIKSVTDS